MSEWWTYRPSDLLLFSPRAYWRLVELYNSDVWPAQLVGVVAGLALLWLAAVPRPAASRTVAALLALAWLWVGWAFHWQHYAAINWAAPFFAGAFWLQAALLVILGVVHGGGQAPPSAGVPNLGWTLAVCGVVLYPLAGLAAGRPWSQAEVFGVMPEPTALASLGLLLAGGQPHARVLCIVPALSFVVGMATLWVLST
jgi:uncharacterized protein DUF6064